MKKQRIPVPNYTQIPNCILDELKNLNEAQIRILMFLCRETFGWHRTTVFVPIRNMMGGTGLSRQGVVNGTKELVESGMLGKQPKGNSFEYFLVVDDDKKSRDQKDTSVNLVDSEHAGPVNLVDSPQSTKLTPPQSTKLTPPILLKKESKESYGNKEIADHQLDGQLDVSKDSNWNAEFLSGWELLFQCEKGRKYSHKGAMDTKAIKRLSKLECDITTLLSAAKMAWGMNDDFHCKSATTIAGFASRINEILEIYAQKFPEEGRKWSL